MDIHDLATAASYDLAAHRFLRRAEARESSKSTRTLVVRDVGNGPVPGPVLDAVRRHAGHHGIVHQVSISGISDDMDRIYGPKHYVPTDVPWRALPVLSDPLYRSTSLKDRSRYSFRPESASDAEDVDEGWKTSSDGRFIISRSSSIPTSDLRGDVRRVILASPYDPVGTRVWFHAVRDVLSMFLDDNVEWHIMTPEGETMIAAAAPSPETRFAYCYRLNMSTIGLRLLNAVGRGIAKTTDVHSENGAVATTRSIVDRFYDPLMLQYLLAAHSFVENGGQNAFAIPEIRRHPLDAKYFDARGADDWNWLDETNGEALNHDSWDWRGTGKHPTLFVPGLRMTGVLEAAAEAGLLEWGHKRCVRRICLTDLGRSFVEAMPRQIRDPDVLCRWIGVEDEGKKRAAMDKWIVRSFWAMKRRVAEIESEDA